MDDTGVDDDCTAKFRINLYRHLLDIDSTDCYSTLCEEHNTLIRVEMYAKRILPYSQRRNPSLTLHDANHSSRVIDNMNRIIDLIGRSGVLLNKTEVEILYVARWHHDIGLLNVKNTYSKENLNGKKHGEYSADMIIEHPDLYDG